MFCFKDAAIADQFIANTETELKNYIGIYREKAYVVIDYRRFGRSGYGKDTIVVGTAQKRSEEILEVCAKGVVHLRDGGAGFVLSRKEEGFIYELTASPAPFTDLRAEKLSKDTTAKRMKTLSGAPVCRLSTWIKYNTAEDSDAVLKLIEQIKKEEKGDI